MIYWILKHIKNLLEHKAIYVAIFFTIIITIASLISLNGIDLSSVRYEDKYLHIISFFFLTLSWLFVIKNKFNKFSLRILIFIAITLYGIIIELLQQDLTTYRHADIFDVLADITGILIAIAIFSRLSNWIKSI